MIKINKVDVNDLEVLSILKMHGQRKCLKVN